MRRFMKSFAAVAAISALALTGCGRDESAPAVQDGDSGESAPAGFEAGSAIASVGGKKQPSGAVP